MFELANRLVGIYKTFNCTKCVALSLENVDEAAAAAAGDPATDNAPAADNAPATNNNVVDSSDAGSFKTASQKTSTSSQSVSELDGIQNEN